MPDRSDISPLSITDGKISKAAKIDPTKLAPATSGQVLIAGTDGKFRPGNLVTTSSGDTVAQGPAGPPGATGSQGATGTTGATGAAGVDGTDATVTPENVDGALGFTGSTAGLVKRTADNTFELDTATYSTTSHTHAHADLTSVDADQHRVINDDLSSPSSTELWSASTISYQLSQKASYSHSHSYSSLTGTPSTFTPSSHYHSGSDITSGTVNTNRLDVGTTSGKVAAGDHTHSGYSTTGHSHSYSSLSGIPSTFAPSSTLAHKSTHATGASDALSPSDIGASADDHTHDLRLLTNYVEKEHIDWTADQQGYHGYIHPDNIEFINSSSGASDAGKPVMLDSDGHIDSSMIAYQDSVDYLELENLPNLSTIFASNNKYTKDITWETNSTGVSFSVTDTTTGDESSAVCTITHNLNTKYIFVSVIEYSTTDTANVPPDNNFVENLQEQVDMNFHLTVKPTNDNNIELYTNSGFIYAGSVFKVAIMG